jgi:flavin reductase (DIM6/NTAB) family NADH-FMN oxidoreductase RutF
MTKVKTGNLAFPVPICVVGTMVKGRINYATYGSFGLLSPRPKNYVYIGSQASRYTNMGINENGYFSVNIPSVDQMQKTDYVGLMSGHHMDKSSVFKSFFGSIDTAPLIEECPVNMLCKLIRTANDIPDRDIFFGEVLETYVDEACLKNGVLDFTRINPLLFTVNGPGNASYWKLGEVVGDAYKDGKALIKPDKK